MADIGVNERSSMGAPCNRKKQVAEWLRRGVSDRNLIFPSHHRHNSDTPCLFVSVSLDHPGRQALLCLTPMKFWQFLSAHSRHKQPCCFPARVPVVPLIHAARPKIRFGVGAGKEPSATASRLQQAEPLPCLAVCRVLYHASPFAHCGQSSSETTTILSKLIPVRFSCAAVPEPSPALAGRVRHYRVRAGVGARVAGFVPRVNSWHAHIADIRLHVQGRNCIFVLHFFVFLDYFFFWEVIR